MGKQYTVSDGIMMLTLEEAAEGGFVVTSPLDPGLVTQAETLQQAFEMAHDAAVCLAFGRKRLAEKLGMMSRSTGANEASSAASGVLPVEGTEKVRTKTKRGRVLKS